MRKHYNPERRTWRGRSYKNGGQRVRDLRDRALARAAKKQGHPTSV